MPHPKSSFKFFFNTLLLFLSLFLFDSLSPFHLLRTISSSRLPQVTLDFISVVKRVLIAVNSTDLHWNRRGAWPYALQVRSRGLLHRLQSHLVRPATPLSLFLCIHCTPVAIIVMINC